MIEFNLLKSCYATSNNKKIKSGQRTQFSHTRALLIERKKVLQMCVTIDQ